MERRIHLVRHGEVHNPEGVIYGRLPGFSLSERGCRTAQTAADSLAGLGRSVSLIRSSPLERARQSAEPIGSTFGLPVETDDDLIEASSKLEGGRFRMDPTIFLKVRAWPYLVNPLRPSWGESFTSVRDRMVTAIRNANNDAGDGDAVLVSHQLPIWMAHRTAAGKPLFHNPGKRRCSLSSITSFVVDGDRIREIDYIPLKSDDVLVDEGAV